MRQWNLYVNPFALVIGTFTSLIISTIWYGPLFGKIWLEYSKLNRKKVEEIQSQNYISKIFTGILGTILAIAIHSVLVHTIPITSIWELLLLDVLLTVGFVAPHMSYALIWGRTKAENFAINVGYQFTNLLVQGLIVLTCDGILGRSDEKLSSL